MKSVLTFWNIVVELWAFIAVVVSALGLMTGAIDRDRIWRRFGTIMAALVLLLMLPPIILGIWRSLTLLDQIGVLALLALGVFAILRGATHRFKKKSFRLHD